LFAFETICRIAFSDSSFTEQDVQDTLVGVKQRFDHWQRWFALPALEKLFYKNVFVRGRLAPSLLLQRAQARVNERLLKGGTGKHADLLDRYLESDKNAPQHFGTGTVVGLTISTIHAGAETTASTLALTMYHLLTNPSALAELTQELQGAKLASPPTYQSVARLPYLEAAIKESMRLTSVNIAPLEREVPVGGAHIAGYYIPRGSAVSLNDKGLALRADVWGPEPEAYRPDRWVKANDAQRSKMERAFSGFGHGKRMCIGKHIAWIEMKKVLPEMLLNYEASTPRLRRCCFGSSSLLSFFP
jgi:cytochrome P450